MASSRSSRAPRRAATNVPASVPADASAVDASEQALHELRNPHLIAAAQEAPTPAAPAAPVEPTYTVEIRLASAALSGDSAYHVSWPASRIRALLAGEMTFVPVPVRPHLPGQAPPFAARYVYIQNIAEVVIHGWSQE